MDRLTSILSQVDSSIIATGDFIDKYKLNYVLNAQKSLFELPVYLYDQAYLNIEKIKLIARQLVTVYGVKIIFIDYLQLIRVPGSKDKTAAVSTASTELKELSRNLNIPIVCAAQLSRDSSNRTPSLSDFQWSSQAEQDADAAILLQRTEDGQTPEVMLHIDKNRDGKTGIIKMILNKNTVTFREKA